MKKLIKTLALLLVAKRWLDYVKRVSNKKIDKGTLSAKKILIKNLN
ncbi:hypothetical protein [Allofustis seminis]|nr:hypothetical protein [Allofustis seminis]